MNPLENKQTDNASLEEKQLVDQAKEKKELELENEASMNSLRDIAAAESEDSTDFHDAPTLYNDVVIDASQLDQDDEGLDFQVEEITLSPENAVPFSVNTDDRAPLLEEDFSSAPAMRADQKVLETRQEPVMLDERAAKTEDSFAAVDPETDNTASDDDAAMVAKDAEEAPKKQRKGSVLGMGWFQGFNLFICGMIFLALAIFAYFMFGDEPLYDGELAKYVVVKNEESGSMGVLNPAIPGDIREGYIYVPKAPRNDDAQILQDKPVLDQADGSTAITKVELLSDKGNSLADNSDVSIETETVDTPAFELLSVDHNADGLSSDDVALAQSMVLQAETAFTQGNYVGVNQSDAYFYYQAALEIDPKNAEALKGLVSIADIYYRSAQDAYRSGNIDIAEQYLAIGLAVQPNHGPLKQLSEQLKQQSVQFPASSNGNAGSAFEGFDFN